MKIIHIILGKSNPDRMNGVNRVVNQLATVQHEQGEDVEVWGITKDTFGNQPQVAYRLHLFQAFRYPFKIASPLKEAIAAQDKTAVFHLHGGFIPVFHTVSKWIVKSGGRYIVSPHGTYSHEAIEKSNTFIKRLYIRFVEKRLLENASCIHLLGASSDEGIKHLKINTKIIPNGFNVTKGDVKRSFFAERPVFGFVGRLSMHHKGLDLMLKGFEYYLSRGNKEARLWLVGDGESKSALKEMVNEMGLKENVIFWGSKFGKEKEDLFKKMDFFVHTSRHEGLPTAMIEAAAFGIPLVGTKGTNFTGYIDIYEAGFVIKENTPESIGEVFMACEKAMKEDTREKMSKNARRLAEEQFDWKIIHQSFKEIYRAA